VFRVEVLKVEAEGVDLNAERAKVRAVEAIVKVLIKIKGREESELQRLEGSGCN